MFDFMAAKAATLEKIGDLETQLRTLRDGIDAIKFSVSGDDEFRRLIDQQAISHNQADSLKGHLYDMLVAFACEDCCGTGDDFIDDEKRCHACGGSGIRQNSGEQMTQGKIDETIDRR